MQPPRGPGAGEDGGSRHPARRWHRRPAMSAIQGMHPRGVRAKRTSPDAIWTGRSPRVRSAEAMNVSRLMSRYPERDDPRRPSIRPTARASAGGTMIANPVTWPAISEVTIPTIEPIRAPVHVPLREPPRRPAPTPTARPQPAPFRTSEWSPVIA